MPDVKCATCRHELTRNLQSFWATSTILNSRPTCLTTPHTKVGQRHWARLCMPCFVAAELPLVLGVAVTELCGRVFGIWTVLTCALCCICARNPCVPSIYGRLQQAIRFCCQDGCNKRQLQPTRPSLCFGLQEPLYSLL